MYGAIEAGGTKINCLVAESITKIIDRCQIPTQNPDNTIQRITDFFSRHNQVGLRKIGLACFGPLDLNPNSPNYGMITTTPKPGWRDFNLKNELEHRLQIPIRIDTDVNASGLGEYKWGIAHEISTFIYLTIGTGIGGAAFVNGKPHVGLSHPEMGHIFIPQDVSLDPFPGICPYHKNCFEGLASGPALMDRWGPNFVTMPPEHVAWKLESTYIAYALVSYFYIFSPKLIIIGGGVMQQQHLFQKIRLIVAELLNNYSCEFKNGRLEDFITPPKLGNESGILGALALAME